MLSRSKLLGVLFIVSLIAWTVALLVPIPSRSSEVLGGEHNKFLFGKSLHASAYAYLTILAGYLSLSIRERWWVLGLLSFHGFATEFFQLFVNRSASWKDVGIDHIGIAIGLLIATRRWRVLFDSRSRLRAHPENQ